jgi:hypothetical protein
MFSQINLPRIIPPGLKNFSKNPCWGSSFVAGLQSLSKPKPLSFAWLSLIHLPGFRPLSAGAADNECQKPLLPSGPLPSQKAFLRKPGKLPSNIV